MERKDSLSGSGVSDPYFWSTTSVAACGNWRLTMQHGSAETVSRLGVDEKTGSNQIRICGD
jgi:hypothetical protein